MARPLWNSLWLRLFGPDGPTTLAELRAAIINGQFGQAPEDGGVIARIRALIAGDANVPPRPDPHGVDGNNLDSFRSQNGTLLLDLRLPVIPGAAVDGPPALTLVTDPAHATAPGSRTATLFVRADPAVALGLIPIEYGPANREAPFLRDASRDDPVRDTWLSTWLVLHQAPMEIAWDADTVGSAEIDPLLGPILGSIVISGDFSAGFTLGSQTMDIDQITLAAGSDYNLVVDANGVATGQTLTVDAQALGAGNSAAFDGSAVTAGSFAFFGGAGDDRFFGGAGDDNVRGLGGADTLTGGGGRDTFVYRAASDSTGAGYDILADFNPAQDRIDLPGTVTGFDAAIQSGALSTGSFNADLGAALAGLGAGHAVVYAPDTGDLAGNIFLVVDANGVAGYQAGEDYVFALPATTLADLSGHTDFFI